MRLPRRLPPGGTIGVISPASPADGHLLNEGIAHLTRLGYCVEVAPHALDTRQHCAGSDTARAADFASFYANPDIDVLWCSRGGSSACRLWPLVDWQHLSSLPPKMLVGYSDITSLHLALQNITEIVVMHGPMVSELAQASSAGTLEWLLRLLTNPGPAGDVPGRAAETLVGGMAEGALCGGCLSLLAAATGTRYQIDAAKKLLFLEDIDEAPHRIERYLVQMREAGILETAAGFVIGEATQADTTDALLMQAIWQEFLAPYGRPAVLGFPAGHVKLNYALPLGSLARLDAGERKVTLLEAGVK